MLAKMAGYHGSRKARYYTALSYWPSSFVSRQCLWGESNSPVAPTRRTEFPTSQRVGSTASLRSAWVPQHVNRERWLFFLYIQGMEMVHFKKEQKLTLHRFHPFCREKATGEMKNFLCLYLSVSQGFWKTGAAHWAPSEGQIYGKRLLTCSGKE